MSPLSGSRVTPLSSLGSILDFRSMMANIEDMADFALEESDVRVLVWDTPIAAILRARNTCIKMRRLAFQCHGKNILQMLQNIKIRLFVKVESVNFS